MSDWWRGAVIYQIYPRSFSDSSGDGVGDLEGIARHLDYVAGLGVEGIWISPFYPSPMLDFGYDVRDYCDVDRMFGDLAAFDRLLSRAHELGLKVILDIVPCHTASEHPWFVESRQSRDNPKADWYIWADPKPDGTQPNNWLAHFGGTAWSWDSRRRQYYMHRFLPEQPALNWHNPDVRQALFDVMAFWLERGVDGLRIDVVNMLFHDTELKDNPPAGIDLNAPLAEIPANPHGFQDHIYEDDLRPVIFDKGLAPIRELLDSYGARTSVGEVGHARGHAISCAYTQGGQRLHQAYSFVFLESDGHPAYLRRVLRQTEAELGDGWLLWPMSNHDCVRAATRWAPLAGGEPLDEATRDRLARVMLAFQLSLRGSACLYQGEELALPEADLPYEAIQDPVGRNFWPEIKGRDGCRTPMPWRGDSAHGAFSWAETPWLPVPEAHRARAVARQDRDPNSVLNFFRAFVPWRVQRESLRAGTMKLLPAESDDDPLLAIERGGERETLVCLLNFDTRERSFRCSDDVALSDAPGQQARLSDGRTVTLPGLSFAFLTAPPAQ